METPTWDKVALCVAMAILFVLELVGIFGRREGFWTITYVVRTYMPGWAQAMSLGWLGYHFLIQTYLKK